MVRTDSKSTNIVLYTLVMRSLKVIDQMPAVIVVGHKACSRIQVVQEPASTRPKIIVSINTFDLKWYWSIVQYFSS